MLALFIKSYYAIILSILIACASVFSLGVYCLSRRFWFRMRNEAATQLTVQHAEELLVEQPQDLTAIAGDDLVSTQLDLARAYIETNQKQQALMILEMIIMQGSVTQQEEAKELMNFL